MTEKIFDKKQKLRVKNLGKIVSKVLQILYLRITTKHISKQKCVQEMCLTLSKLKNSENHSEINNIEMFSWSFFLKTFCII